MRGEGLTRPRRAFTLIELLITLALLGVVGTIVARLMMDQQRFYQRTNEQMNVRRELRTAMSLLPSDLRSMSTVGGDLLDFDAGSITFRATIGTGIVCARPSASMVDLPPLNSARTTLTSWYSTPQIGDTLFAFRADSMGAGGDQWSAHRVTGIMTNPALCPGSPFLDAINDAGKDRWRVTVEPALPDSVVVGAVLRFTRPTRYALVQARSGRWYLGRSEWQSTGWTTPTEIAGPFLAPSATGTGGLAITMFDSLGLAVTSPAQARTVSRMDVTLRGQGAVASGRVGGSASSNDSLVFRVALRNRQ